MMLRKIAWIILAGGAIVGLVWWRFGQDGAIYACGLPLLILLLVYLSDPKGASEFYRAVRSVMKKAQRRVIMGRSGREEREEGDDGENGE